jgi:hypothetical protein
MKEFGNGTDTSTTEATAQNGNLVLRPAREAFSPLALHIIEQFNLKEPGERLDDMLEGAAARPSDYFLKDEHV